MPGKRSSVAVHHPRVLSAEEHSDPCSGQHLSRLPAPCPVPPPQPQGLAIFFPFSGNLHPRAVRVAHGQEPRANGPPVPAPSSPCEAWSLASPFTHQDQKNRANPALELSGRQRPAFSHQCPSRAAVGLRLPQQLRVSVYIRPHSATRAPSSPDMIVLGNTR